LTWFEDRGARDREPEGEKVARRKYTSNRQESGRHCLESDVKIDEIILAPIKGEEDPPLMGSLDNGKLTWVRIPSAWLINASAKRRVYIKIRKQILIKGLDVTYSNEKRHSKETPRKNHTIQTQCLIDNNLDLKIRLIDIVYYSIECSNSIKL
jgi:hypothetical protein